MRTISEQELKDILDKHGKWLRGQENGEKADLRSADLSSANLRSANLDHADLSSADLRSADLSSANLRYADLRSADLSSANLRYADFSSANLRYAYLDHADLSSANLRYADLRYADLRYANLMIFQFRRHQALYTFDGALRIGCISMPITEWILRFEEIGRANDYAIDEIKAYGGFIKLCAKHFKDANL